jgi:anaerobic magnesium-protoporphyrin IX monomethyl ester cyclase
MHVRFVYPAVDPDPRFAKDRPSTFQLGIGYISAVLKQVGHRTSLQHIYKPVSKGEFLKCMEEQKPDLVCFSSTTNQFEHVRTLSTWVKELDLPVLLGGVHATLAPEEAILHPAIDFVCIGEGEYPTLELANALQNGESTENIRNIWSKEDKIIKRNEIRPLISNLDELPFPDREIFDYKTILKNNGYRADIIAGRGCPFSCTYCSNNALRKVFDGKGKYVRMRTVDNVLKEIEEITKKYELLSLDFQDDTFTLNPDWVKQFCEQYPKRFKVKFWCNSRPETLNKEIVAALKSAGCHTVAIGIESGNEWLRKNVLKRHTTNEQIINAFKIVTDAGIGTYALNMIGLPYETAEMIEDTIKINKIVSPTNYQLSIFYPFPKTELWNLCATEGFITDQSRTNFMGDSVLKLPTLSKKQIRLFYRKFEGEMRERRIKTCYPTILPFYTALKVMFGEMAFYKFLSSPRTRYILARALWLLNTNYFPSRSRSKARI